jgi:putative acetyltransferase
MEIDSMIIRGYRTGDCVKIAELFRDTVHSINAGDYNQNQIDAWAPKEIDAAAWDKKLSSSYSVVAEIDGVIVGFGDADGTGYFDHLYTHKDYQGIGIATQIANDIENHCAGMGIHSITTAASITARPFFEKRGYIVLKRQYVELRGQSFINFLMEKDLYQ